MKRLLFTIPLLLTLLATNGPAATLKPGLKAKGRPLEICIYPRDIRTTRSSRVWLSPPGTVKEQMAGTYAAEMADRGYVALAFDFRGWGQRDSVFGKSEAENRGHPCRCALLGHAARSGGKPDRRLGDLRLDMSDATLANSHIKALALVAPWLHNADIVKVVYGGEEGVKSLIQMSREAEQSPEPIILEAASLTNDKAVMYQAPYYTETDRGLISAYDNKFNAASWEGWLTYDALQTAEQLKKPTLLVHSEAAAIPQGAHEYARRMGSNVTELWLDGVSQFDFYDAPSPITAASDAVAAFQRNP